jgi:hypothetical protein
MITRLRPNDWMTLGNAMAVGTGPDVRGSDLIDGKPDGLHVLPLPPLLPPVLLHQRHQEAAP